MTPSIAIVIPCRNEEKYILRCVESLLNSEYPKNKFDIYICDGFSEDNTRKIVKELAINNSNIHLLDNPQRTTPYALNIGLKASSTEVKIILGAHAEVYSDFLKENINTLYANPDAHCVGGIIENIYEDKISKIIGMAMSSSFGVGNAHFRTGMKEGYVDTVAFGAYRSKVFDKVGYFDEDLTRNQDDEFNYRLIKNNLKIYLNNKIKSRYYVRGSFKKLVKQYKQYGYWKVYVNKKHKTVTTLRQTIPLLFFLFICSFIPVIQLDNIGIITKTYFIIFLIYLVLGFLFSFKKAGLSKDILLVFYAFLLLHLSYGCGYFIGIIDFILLNKRPSISSEKLTR